MVLEVRVKDSNCFLLTQENTRATSLTICLWPICWMRVPLWFHRRRSDICMNSDFFRQSLTDANWACVIAGELHEEGDWWEWAAENNQSRRRVSKGLNKLSKAQVTASESWNLWRKEFRILISSFFCLVAWIANYGLVS